MTDNYLFCFGMGYSASVLADALKTQGWRVGGTSRTPEKRQLMRQQNVRAFDLDDKEAIAQELESVTHILISIPPSVNGDEVLATSRLPGYMAIIRAHGSMSQLRFRHRVTA